MPCLFCIFDEGGKALLTKSQGDIQTPSFPTVALLYGMATFTEVSGFDLQRVSSANVRVVYQRFSKDQLLFVLATSSMLVSVDRQQRLLQTVYAALQLFLGSVALILDTTLQMDALKRQLKGLTVLNTLIADDCLVPCLLLSLPQVIGLPPGTHARLERALLEMAVQTNSTYAAIVGEGHYLATTPDWWLLKPTETLLLQHVAAHSPQSSAPQETPLFLPPSGRHAGSVKLVTWKLQRSGQASDLVVLLIVGSPVTASVLPTLLKEQLAEIDHTLEEPAWCRPSLPQLAPVTFDLALVLDHRSGRATQLWGRSSPAPRGAFDPLASPTLRRQPNKPAPLDVSSLSSVSTHGATPDDLQLVHTSLEEMLLTFILQQRPALQLEVH
ncbi:MAG: hypothetical protein WDW36_006050 [Sanguina aurantia]